MLSCTARRTTVITGKVGPGFGSLGKNVSAVLTEIISWTAIIFGAAAKKVELGRILPSIADAGTGAQY